MRFKLHQKLESGVRIGEIQTPHGSIKTPFFMPVGTVGSVKSVLPRELDEIGAQIVLSNTYHLYLRPGEQLISQFGGLHEFMRWSKPILTDSGGYQVFSLGDRGKEKDSLVKISADGVEFKSHLDGSKHFFTPEKVIQIQLDLGVDILMPLDVCPSGKADREEVRKATELTIEWARRAKEYFDSKVGHLTAGRRPGLHGIVQGGLDPELRRYCAAKLIEIGFDGYSVGGLAVDLETRDMWGIVRLMGEILPEDKPRYLMGVGTPDDIVKLIHLGMDMFDCVLPTRLARHGSVYLRNRGEGLSPDRKNYDLVNIKNAQYRADKNVLDNECGCPACAGGFSRGYISHLLRSNEITGLRLATLHNLFTYLELTREYQGTGEMRS
ncbi:MAG: Queuine tRNA-ribosyltransferase [bacterium ADurb.Bin400]|nr:MAG: Queuine tRNA-ribosyltransferase [bacterium ADurb.Bin400]